MQQPPPDAWLKGYFYSSPTDLRGVEFVPSTVWKNVDFIRLRDSVLHLLGPLAGKSVLDVGCASGAFMVYCGLQGANVYGQDLNETSVAEANGLIHRFGVSGEAKVGDARTLQFDDDSMDAAISNDFFEHIDDDVKVEVLTEIRRVLKPGAPLVVRTPNLAYLRLALLYKRIRAVARLKNPFRFIISHSKESTDPEHIGLTTRFALTRCILDAGFQNYRFHYSPLRRFGRSALMEILSTEIPIVRDHLSEDLLCLTYKPIVLSYFPD